MGRSTHWESYSFPSGSTEVVANPATLLEVMIRELLLTPYPLAPRDDKKKKRNQTKNLI